MQSDIHDRRRGKFGLALFLCLGVFLLCAIAYFTWTRRSAERDIAALRSEHDELRALATQVDGWREQGEEDKQIILAVLAECRAAQDIPDFQGTRVVARQVGGENLRLYVPDGRHELVISAIWQPLPSGKTAIADRGDASEFAGEKTWTVPLLSSSGYWLDLLSDRDGGPVRWELTSNHPAFETTTESLPLEGFSRRGGSWQVTDGVVGFPNQIERFTLNDLQGATREPGIPLMDATMSGLLGDRTFEVRFEVRLVSNEPASVSASDARRLITTSRKAWLLPYEGDGKYELRRVDAAEK